MTESFADAPQSITELRSDKSGSAKDWTPRDALVTTLREIDTGKFGPEHIVIMWAYKTDDGLIKTGRRFAGKFTTLEFIGLIEDAKHKVIIDG